MVNRKVTKLHFLLHLLLGCIALVAVLLYVQKPSVKMEPVPGFGLEDFNGNVTRLEDYRGRPIIINFWAAWCAECRDEMPILERIYQTYKDQGLVVLGVHRSGTESDNDARAFAHEVGVTYPLIRDERNRIFGYFNQGLTAIPTSVFIDRKGYISTRTIGPRKENELIKLVRDIL